MKRARSNITTLVLQKRIFWSIAVAILILFTFYGYFVSKSIANILLREEAEQQILLVNSNIGELEFKYLNQKNTITLGFAYENGFYDIGGKEFVARKSVLSKRLTLNNEI